MMKNLLSAIVMVLLAMPMYAQEIVVDKTNQDGTRMIATDTKYIAKSSMDKHPLGFSLGYIEIEGIGRYSIDLKISSFVNFKLPKGGLLLIKTPSGKVIECKQILEDYETEDVLGTRISGTSLTTHTINGVYYIKLEELEAIANEGISKIRIERPVSVIDSEYKPKKTEKIKEIFSSRLKVLKEALNKTSNIRDGF